MKKFFKILICCVLCVFAFGLTACKHKDSYVYPKSSAETYGNGGMAVQKGDYLYFVNGYLAVDDLKESQQHSKFDVGSLMIAKLDENGNAILNEDGLLDDEYYRTMSTRLCGFEATNLFISGDYLYFATPCRDDASGRKGWAKELLDIYRIKLDKSGKAKRVYRSGVDRDKVELAFYDDGILAYESGANNDNKSKNNMLYQINGTNKVTVESDVVSVKFSKTDPTQVYYVLNDEEHSLYTMYRYNVKTKKSDEFYSSATEIKITAVTENYVFIEQEENGFKNIYRANLIDNNPIETDPVVTYKSDKSATYEYSPDGNAILEINKNKINFYVFGNSNVSLANVVDANTESITTIGFNENSDFVYYDDKNLIKKINYGTALLGNTPDIVTLTDEAIEDIDTKHFDLDGNYLYFYKTVGTNSYLHRINVNNNYSNQTEIMIGVYLEKDIPKTTKE